MKKYRTLEPAEMDAINGMTPEARTTALDGVEYYSGSREAWIPRTPVANGTHPLLFRGVQYRVPTAPDKPGKAKKVVKRAPSALARARTALRRTRARVLARAVRNGGPRTKYTIALRAGGFVGGHTRAAHWVIRERR